MSADGSRLLFSLLSSLLLPTIAAPAASALTIEYTASDLVDPSGIGNFGCVSAPCPGMGVMSSPYGELRGGASKGTPCGE